MPRGAIAWSFRRFTAGSSQTQRLSMAEADYAAVSPLRRLRADQARLVGRRPAAPDPLRGYPDGLPAEAELAAEFAVSRNAIREALSTLKDEGLIGRATKVGTHVAVRKVRPRPGCTGRPQRHLQGLRRGPQSGARGHHRRRSTVGGQPAEPGAR